MRTPRATIACLAAAAVTTGGCAGLVEEPPATPARDAAPRVLPDAVAARGIARVTVPVLSRDGFARRAQRFTVRIRNLSCEGLGTGSGFAVTSSILVTNRHVVAGADDIQVDTADGRSFRASAAQVGVLGDVAFVAVDTRLPVVADTGGTAPAGAAIAAVGYPLGGPFTILRGVVVDTTAGEPFGIGGPVIRITADVQPGNSGGPLLDRRGRVAGVIFAIENATGFGLAIPIATVRDLLARAGTTSVPPCGSE